MVSLQILLGGGLVVLIIAVVVIAVVLHNHTHKNPPRVLPIQPIPPSVDKVRKTSLTNGIYITGGVIDIPLPNDPNLVPFVQQVVLHYDPNGEAGWEQFQHMHNARCDHVAVVSGDAPSLYVLGGRQGTAPDDLSVPRIESYPDYTTTPNPAAADTKVDDWEIMSSCPLSLISHVGAALDVNSKKRIYIAGGAVAGSSNRSLLPNTKYFEPDSTSCEWKNAPDLPTPLENAASAVSANGVWYVTGGKSSLTHEQLSSEVYVFDTSAGWKTLKKSVNASKDIQMYQARWGHGAAHIDNKLYVFGGYTNFDGTTRTALTEIFDFATKAWVQFPPSMKFERADFASTVHDGKIYVFGGETLPPFGTCEVFDPAGGAWQTFPAADLNMHLIRSSAVTITDAQPMT